MNIVQIEDEKNEIKNIIINPALFQDGKEIQGIFFPTKIEKTTSRSNRVYARITGLGVRGKRVQVNIYNIDNNENYYQQLSSLINNPCFLEGRVEEFNGIIYIVGLSLSLVPENVSLTKEDFQNKLSNIEDLRGEFNNLLIQEDSTLNLFVQNIYGMKCFDVLASSTYSDMEEQSGEGLLVCLQMANSMKQLCDNLGIEEKNFYILMTIFCNYLITVLEEKIKQNTKLINNIPIRYYSQFHNLIVKKELFGNKYMSIGLEEFSHFYSCMFMGEEPKTLFTKFFKTEFNTQKNLVHLGLTHKDLVKGDSIIDKNGEVIIRLK